MSAGSAAFREMKGSVTRSRSISYLIYLDRTAKLKRTETKLCGNELFILYARSACFSLTVLEQHIPKNPAHVLASVHAANELSGFNGRLAQYTTSLE